MSSPRDKVIDAALSLAARRDYGDITLNDIAFEAEITLADLRDLFPSKGAILGGFIRRIDKKVIQILENVNDHHSARERLFNVLKCRLKQISPYRVSLISIKSWVDRDPLIALALNKELINSMRFMLEIADLESDGPVGALKLQGMVVAWMHVINAWIAQDEDAALITLDKEMVRGEHFLNQAEKLTHFTQPAVSLWGAILNYRNKNYAKGTDDDFPSATA